jgi:hypothetical protein
MNNENILGCPITAFYVLLFIQATLFILSIFLVLDILKNNQIPWMFPVLISLMMLFLLVGWYPGVGIILFLAILILFLYNENHFE